VNPFQYKHNQGKNMIKKMSLQIFMCLLGTTFSVSSLQGQEENNHIPVRSRPSAVIEQLDDAEQLNIEMPPSEERITNHGMFYTSHPGAFHSITSVSVFGDALELEDGSIWTVYPGDGYKALDCHPGDVVVITPYEGWFSSYDFKLTNQNTGASLLTNLKLGPFYDSALSHWIVAINYDENKVYLEDGSEWSMSYFDYGTVRKWLPDDTVIIAINDSIFTYANPNVLINVNMMNCAAGIASY
jgi:hypothetical protein